MRVISRSLAQTKSIAKEFLKKLNLKEPQATVVGLKGVLGSGKTTFVQRVGELLGIKGHITSPTFVIIKHYRLQTSPFANLIHVDAYRIKKSKELKLLDWRNLLMNGQNLIFVEWPENIKEVLPKNLIEIHLELINQSERVIKIKWPKKRTIRKAEKRE